jgi:adenylosuccinate synthase
VFETVPGWQKDITKVRKLEDLPKEARNYLDRLSALIERPVQVVSIGPDREQTIFAG